MGARKACAVPGCELPEDKDTETGLCRDHAHEWRRSKEYTEAVMDEDVKAAFALGAKKEAMRYVAKHRRRWVKRISSDEPGSEEASP